MARNLHPSSFRRTDANSFHANSGGGWGIVLPCQGLEQGGVRRVPAFLVEGLHWRGGHSQLFRMVDESAEGVGHLVGCAEMVDWGVVEDREPLQPPVEFTWLSLRRMGGEEGLECGVVRPEGERPA